MNTTVQDGTSDILRETLSKLRVSGAIFLRAEYTEPWAYLSVDGPTTAAILLPQVDRLVLFHLVAFGRCWISLPDGEKHWAEAGDVIVIPYGDQHLMGGSSPADVIDLTTVLVPPPWHEMPVIRHGLGGPRTDVVCGYLHSDDVLFDPRMRALPEIFVVHPPPGPAAHWVSASIDFAVDTTAGRPTDPMATRLPELLLVEVLRLHLSSAPGVEGSWLAALHDPVVGPAMAKLHADPRRHWTVTDLAAECAVSRSLLDGRFRKVLRRAPIRYLTDWRLHVAEVLLADTTDSVAKIARSVGYDSDEGFSRSFKRARGMSPSAWREGRR
ncbi:MAG TPA: AraC family transcriptional regulator [Aldersonia sp.]